MHKYKDLQKITNQNSKSLNLKRQTSANFNMNYKWLEVQLVNFNNLREKQNKK